MSSLKAIEGISGVYADKLKAAGISSAEDLLAICAAKKDREEIIESTGIPEKLVVKWTRHADLVRIKGIAGALAELLEASGAGTTTELACFQPDELLNKMVEINTSKKLIRHLPNLKQLGSWIDHAKGIPKILHD